MVTPEMFDQYDRFGDAVAGIIRDTISELAKERDFFFTEHNDHTKPYTYKLLGETKLVEFHQRNLCLDVTLDQQALKKLIDETIFPHYDKSYNYPNLVILPTTVGHSGPQTILVGLYFGFHRVGPTEAETVSKTPRSYSSPLSVVPSPPEEPPLAAVASTSPHLTSFHPLDYVDNPEQPLQRVEGNVIAEPSCFAMAFNALKQNKRVQRQAWVPEDYLVLVSEIPNMVVCENRPLAVSGIPVGTNFAYTSHIYMFRFDGPNSRLIPWSVSQEDILSNDWVVV